MITWIQKYFQQHFKVVFGVLLAVVIIAFVFTIGAAPGIGQGDRRGVPDRYFFDYNLSHAGDQQRLMGDAALSASLRLGSFANLDPEQVQNYAFQRAATLHLADKWHIPAAADDEIKKQIESMRMFMSQDGKFDPKAYATFRDNLKTNPRGVNEADVRRVISDDVRAEKVQNLLAGPGYVLATDVKNQLERADTAWTLVTAAVDYKAFNPEIKPTEAELTQFFEQSGGRYDVPPKVVVSYVQFPVSEYLAKVNVTEADVRAFYDRNPSRFPKPADFAKPATPMVNVTPPSDPAADFAAVRSQVEAALKSERAQSLALKDASDLSVALYEAKVTDATAAEAYLAKRNQKLKALPPLTRESVPPELGGAPAVAEQAFGLSKDKAVSDPISTPEGAVILFWRETQPSHKPAFATVKDQVATDYIEVEKRKRFVELGKKIKGAIEARVKAGDDFEKAAATAASQSGLKAETKKVAEFTLRNRPQDVDYAVLGTLERMEKGQVSDMVISADKGLFVYAASKKAPEASESNPRFAETRAQIAGYTSRLGAAAYLQELVEKELKKSEPKSE